MAGDSKRNTQKGRLLAADVFSGERISMAKEKEVNPRISVIIDIVKQKDGTIRPSQTLREVCEKHGFSYSEAQDALAAALEYHHVIATPDRFLRTRKAKEQFLPGRRRSA